MLIKWALIGIHMKLIIIIPCQFVVLKKFVFNLVYLLIFTFFIQFFEIKVEHRSLTLGEVLDGDRMALSMYKVQFKGLFNFKK